ncbi:MAG TPA: SWIM zinc finger family protein [Chloroflexota bacterium]|nr:SWIM zinc finger family protein [Chloroflexota bacterium]
MTTIPSIGEHAILEQVGERSFALGQQYVESDAIFEARQQGMSLKARCEGTSGGPYRVQVNFDGDRIKDASCSCPVGEGGHCKHVAALLLTWLRDPAQFMEIEETETALERRSKAELIALIKQMLRQQPTLELLLETPLPVAGARPQRVDGETYRRQVAAVFRGVEYEWGEEIGIASELDAIKAIGDGFLEQGQYANALAVYEAILTRVLDQFESFSDEGGELGGVVTDCVDGLGACLAAETDTVTREAILRQLFAVFQADTGFGGFGLSDAVPELLMSHASADERQLVADWVWKALPTGGNWSGDFARQTYGAFLLQLRADTLQDEEYLRISRETGRLHDLVARLLALGRVDEAIAEAARADDHPLLGLADLLAQHEQGEAAERLVRERSATSQDRRLQVWLKDRYRARNDLAAALDIALPLFRAMPDLGQYRELRTLAQQLDRWEALRPELLTALRDSRHTNLLIEVYLDDGDIDRALETLNAAQAPGARVGYGFHHFPGAIELKVAEAAEASRPQAAREIYQRYAERLIEARGRENYQVASTLLAKVRDLYARLGDQEEWTHAIAALREKNRALRALKDELARAGL